MMVVKAANWRWGEYIMHTSWRGILQELAMAGFVMSNATTRMLRSVYVHRNLGSRS